MKKNKYGLIAGIIIIALTVILYALLVDNLFKLPMAYITLFCLLASEIITVGSFVFMKNDYKRLLVSAIFAVHAAVIAVLSVIFINIFVFAYTAYTVIYLISLAGALLLTVFISGFTAKQAAIDKDFSDAKTSMLRIRAVVNGMINSDNGKKYASELKKLDENLRFTDDSVTDELDNTISEKVINLSENIADPDFDVLAAIAGINDVIKQRNFVVKSSKPYSR